MTDAQLAQIKANTERWEGRTAYLYRDSSPAGLATVGCGRMVPTFEDCCALPFLPAITRVEWDRLMSEPKGCRASFYQNVTTARLSDAAIDALLDQAVASLIAQLTAAIYGYENLPDGPQAALFDMAYNLGVSGLTKGYPKLMTAVGRQDWATCAAECHRNGISAQRNQQTADLFSGSV